MEKPKAIIVKNVPLSIFAFSFYESNFSRRPENILLGLYVALMVCN